MQEKHKFLTIAVLVLFSTVLFLAFSSQTKATNLNANNNQNNNQTTPFTYQNARASTLPSVLLENNFGGSKQDEICKVLNLDYYYLIGNTTSTDKYFQGNTVASVFVIKMSRSGSVIALNTTNTNALSYVDSYVGNNGIYLVAKSTQNNSTTLLHYQFATTALVSILQIEELSPLAVTQTENTVAILGHKNNRVSVAYYNLLSNDTQVLNTTIVATECKLFTAYSTGFLALLNSSSAFYAYLLTQNSFTPKYTNANNTLTNFSIGNNGFFFVLQNAQTVTYLFLNFQFEKTNQTLQNKNGNQFYLVLLNNNHYVFYQTSSGMQALLFSQNGDLVLQNSIPYLGTLQKVNNMGNTLLLALLTADGNLQVIALNALFMELNTYHLPFSTTSTVLEMEINYDNHLMLFGNSVGNHSITNNFGLSDAFVCKLQNNLNL